MSNIVNAILKLFVLIQKIFLINKKIMLEIYFFVSVTTGPGESVQIAGSIPDLGSWDPEKALQLTFKNGYWKGSIRNVRPGIF